MAKYESGGLGYGGYFLILLALLVSPQLMYVSGDIPHPIYGGLALGLPILLILGLVAELIRRHTQKN